jgi:hypothetical protein
MSIKNSVPYNITSTKFLPVFFIKFLYLKEPNTAGTNVISFQGQIPPEFGLDKYVDYDMMFQKAFLEPLNSLLECVNWQLKEKATLDELFGM